ncbi:MAG: hypothetical protein WC295_11240 [Methanoregula sp.]
MIRCCINCFTVIVSGKKIAAIIQESRMIVSGIPVLPDGVCCRQSWDLQVLVFASPTQ